MENHNLALVNFNVERVAKVLFALKDEDDLLYLQDDDFKLLDEEGNLTNKYDENIFIQFAKGGAGGFGSADIIKQFFPEEFKDDIDFFMQIAEVMSDFKEVFLELASEKILSNKNFAKTIVSNCNGGSLKYFSEEIRSSKEIVIIAVTKNGSELQHASDELKKDREIVLIAIKARSAVDFLPPDPIQYADKSFLSDFEMARIAVASSGNSLQYFADEIRQDKDIVSIAVNNSPHALEFADKSLLSDKDFILSLPSSAFKAFSILGDKLKKDHDVVAKAIALNCDLYQDLPKNLKEDLFIFTEALKDRSFASRKSLPLMVENAPLIITQDVNTCKKIISRDLSFFQYLPISLQSNEQIISFWSKLETKNYSELDEEDLIIFLPLISRDQKSWFRENEETAGQTLQKIKTIDGAKSIVAYLGDLESDIYQNLDKKLLANEEVLNAAINSIEKSALGTVVDKSASSMKYIISTIPETNDHRDYVEKALMKYGLLLEFFPENLRNDRALAEIAINQDARSFKYLSEELKDNNQIINCLVSALLQKKIESSHNSFNGGILRFASNRIKKDRSLAYKLSNYGYVMPGFESEKNIVMNALKHNPYAEFGDVWDFDIARIAPIYYGDLDNDNVKHIVKNKEMMGMQLILAINSSRSGNLVENTKPYFDKLNYAWVTDNNIGVEDEYYDNY